MTCRFHSAASSSIELYDQLDRQQDGVLAKIRERKALDDELTAEIKSTLADFKERFLSRHSEEAVAS